MLRFPDLWWRSRGNEVTQGALIQGELMEKLPPGFSPAPDGLPGQRGTRLLPGPSHSAEPGAGSSWSSTRGQEVTTDSALWEFSSGQHSLENLP